MARLWKVIDGEPYMINPRLGILALASLNPKKGKKTMARRKHGARHMAWVRSFRKNPRRHRRRNPYSVAGPVAALAGNPYRRRKRNPSRARAYATKARGFLGMPPLMPIVYGTVGYAGTGAVSGVVMSFVPATWRTNADGSENKLTKYVVLAGSLIAASFIAKAVFGPGPAALVGIGGGIYVVRSAINDFMPGVIPGFSNYAPIASYRQVREYAQVRGMGASEIGARNTANTGSGENIVAARFRRFQ